MIFLLAGNPNVGKSTLFNFMTESHVHVGNYSGVTVEKRVHHIRYFEGANLVDLPGTYNVSPSSADEGVVTYSLLNETYNGVINIVDSTHLKRNLHLTVQLLELGVPTLLVFNLKDALKNNGYIVDTNKVSELLGIGAINISARERNRSDQDEIVTKLKTIEANKALELDYHPIIIKAMKRIHELLRYDPMRVKKKWLALQLLEGNEGIYKHVKLIKEKEIREIVLETEKAIIEQGIAFSLKGAIFTVRREFIAKIVDSCLVQVEEKEHSKYFNQKIDRILTHPASGIPFFLVVMLSIYQISFGTILGVGVLLTEYFEKFYNDIFVHYTGEFLEYIGITDFAYGLLIDGILGGIGGILVFLPQIVVLFFLLAILEGTGYMARVAIVMDRFLSIFGFNGKSIVPIITGFGCTVPAIMATRTIPDEKERIITILTIPFVSCSARLPIYAIFVSLFFDSYRAIIIMGIYLLGILVTLLSAKLLSLTYFKGAGSKFLLELPPYRIPQLRTISYQAFEKAKRFVKKAGTFILVGSIILWLLSNVGTEGIDITPSESILSDIAGFIAPIFTPLGFGDWQATSALISGFLAKEVVVSSLNILYVGDIASGFTALSALTYIVFSSLYVPCISTVAIIRTETNSRKWTLFATIYPFFVAYLVAMIVRLIFMPFL